jgi:predicted nucleotidyltransferase
MEILKCEYGSRAYGTNNDDSDHDSMSVIVESKDQITGLNEIRTSENHTAKKGERSAPWDRDEVVYPLRQFARLAAKGNPTVLTAFFAPEYQTMTSLGYRLTTAYPLFISRSAGARFQGYARNQLNALLGMRNKKTNRPELVHKHGFDTKFAYHVYRLLSQGIELMVTGALELPLDIVRREICLEIRDGKWSKDRFIEFAQEMDAQLGEAIANSKLQAKPQSDKINELLHGIYMETWK